MEPLISVLIPTCNRPTLVQRAVASALALRHDDRMEIVVTDNSSDDLTQQLLQNLPGIRYSRNTGNLGPVLNWRKALELSTGRYAVILPDDDWFTTGSALQEAADLAQRHAVDLVIADTILTFPGREKTARSHLPRLCDGWRFVRRTWHTSSVPTISNLFSRQKALDLDCFQHNHILYSDMELWFKLAATGKVGALHRPISHYFFHGDNIATNMSADDFSRNAAFIPRVTDSWQKHGHLEPAGVRPMRHSLLIRYLSFISAVGATIDEPLVQAAAAHALVDSIKPQAIIASVRRHGSLTGRALRWVARTWNRL